MHILSALLLSVSANLDNLFLGMAYGLQNRRVTAFCNVLIGLLSAAATFVCCAFASLFTHYVRAAGVVGGLLIIALGVRALSAHDGDAPDASPESGALPLREGFVLGLALAVNCLALSFGAGLTGVSPLPAAVAVGLASVVTVGLGNRMGLRAGVVVSGRRLERISGIIMIVLGAGELFF
ncbi:manganese efflux pump MntP [Agathobaculum sp.]|uniref:manganese efflux pump MntP n=1 Tax=Agathobaculum sp. TaxID=2048138 RepID=UPI002A7F3E73|nr:manganese efflux pump [Agathobaculum sp.]MDY3619181.1 hypothetical protein [Agathobaculum sp.]